MHFYCFSTLFTSDFTDFSVSSASSVVFSSPIQELETGATPCRGGRCAAAILTDRSSRKQKYLDYDVVPADGVEPPQRPCHARDVVWGYFLILDSTQQYIKSRGTLSSAAYQCGGIHLHNQRMGQTYNNRQGSN